MNYKKQTDFFFYLKCKNFNFFNNIFFIGAHLKIDKIKYIYTFKNKM